MHTHIKNKSREIKAIALWEDFSLREFTEFVIDILNQRSLESVFDGDIIEIKLK